MRVFKLEFKDPLAGWITVSAGYFKDIHEAIAASEENYNSEDTRVALGTLDDLVDALEWAPSCLECRNPLGLLDGKLVCASCGAIHTYETGEEYLK